MRQYKFPHHVKDKERLLIWTPEQVIPFAGMFALGIITDMLTLFALLGVLASHMYTRYSDGKPDGHLIHMAYWYGFAKLGGRSFINPYHRRILPK